MNSPARGPAHTLIIVEPGSTHEGDMTRMIRLVDLAADCGVGVFKNQWLSDAKLLCARRKAPDYLDSYRKLAYPLDWHLTIRDHANDRGLEYGCSVYLPGDAVLMAPYVDWLKISSFEAGDDALIAEAIAVKPGRVIVSTGMGRHPASLLKHQPSSANAYRVLHCTSAYPCPIEALDLAVLHDPGRWYDGLSDHSRDVRVGAWAVCAGAQIIEAHVRLDDTSALNRDSAVSFTPREFREYVKQIRDAERAMGDGVKKTQTAEADMLRYRVGA